MDLNGSGTTNPFTYRDAASCYYLYHARRCYLHPAASQNRPERPLGIHGSVQLEVCLGPWLACLACYSLATRLRLNFFMQQFRQFSRSPWEFSPLSHSWPWVAIIAPNHLFIVQQVSGCWRKFCDSKKSQISMNNKKSPLCSTMEATYTKWSCNSLSERWLSHWRGPSSVNLWFATGLHFLGHLCSSNEWPGSSFRAWLDYKSVF